MLPLARFLVRKLREICQTFHAFFMRFFAQHLAASARHFLARLTRVKRTERTARGIRTACAKHSARRRAISPFFTPHFSTLLARF